MTRLELLELELGLRGIEHTVETIDGVDVIRAFGFVIYEEEPDGVS